MRLLKTLHNKNIFYKIFGADYFLFFLNNINYCKNLIQHRNLNTQTEDKRRGKQKIKFNYKMNT